MCTMLTSIASRLKDLELVDLDPKQAVKRDHIIGVWRDCCTAHGGAEVGTPTLMDTSMKNMYRNTVGHMVCTKDGFLRYDLTVPLLGHCARNNMKQGKFMQRGESYRIKNGKTVTMFQLDFDVLGECAPMVAEAECVRLISEVSKNLNLEHVRFRISHFDLLICILKVCGLLNEATQIKALKILAEHNNCLEEANILQEKLITAGIDGQSAAQLLKYLELKVNFKSLDELEKELPDAKKIIEQLRCFLNYCTNFRVPFEVCVCLNLVREFDYYTGLMLECICDDDGIPRVIACGGRYDRLACRVKEGFEVQCMGFTFCMEALRDLYLPLSLQETSFNNLGIMVCLPLPHYSFWHGDTTDEVVLNGAEDEREPPSKDSVAEERLSVMILCPDTEGAIKLVDEYTQETQEYMSPLQEEGPT